MRRSDIGRSLRQLKRGRCVSGEGGRGEGERVGRFMCEERTCLWKE